MLCWLAGWVHLATPMLHTSFSDWEGRPGEPRGGWSRTDPVRAALAGFADTPGAPDAAH